MSDLQTALELFAHLGLTAEQGAALSFHGWMLLQREQQNDAVDRLEEADTTHLPPGVTKLDNLIRLACAYDQVGRTAGRDEVLARARELMPFGTPGHMILLLALQEGGYRLFSLVEKAPERLPRCIKRIWVLALSRGVSLF